MGIMYQIEFVSKFYEISSDRNGTDYWKLYFISSFNLTNIFGMLPTFWPNQRPSVPLVFSCMFSISSQTVVIYSPTISQSNIYILRIILSSSFSLTTCDFKFPKLKGGVANKKIVINLWNFHRRSSQPVTC